MPHVVVIVVVILAPSTAVVVILVVILLDFTFALAVRSRFHLGYIKFSPSIIITHIIRHHSPLLPLSLFLSQSSCLCRSLSLPRPFIGLASLFVFGVFVFLLANICSNNKSNKNNSNNIADNNNNNNNENSIKYVFRLYGVLICFVAKNTSRRGNTLGLG